MLLSIQLLTLFQFKHFACDFLLQNKWMLGKFRRDIGFILPLASHSGVQAIGTWFVLWVALKGLWLPLHWYLYAILFDFVTHFAIDRLKASPNLLGRFNDVKKPEFWACVGLDQMLHQLVYLIIVMTILEKLGG